METEKKIIVVIKICQQLENEALDALFLKKTYEMCVGKKHTLEALERHYNTIKEYIKTKLVFKG